MVHSVNILNNTWRKKKNAFHLSNFENKDTISELLITKIASVFFLWPDWTV